MKIDFDRHVPLGWNGKKTAAWLCAALAASFALGLWCFLDQYRDCYRQLFVYSAEGEKLWIPDRVMLPFPNLVTDIDIGFGLVLCAMPLLALFAYLYHWRGSCSIYLMRRLPNRWELHRRCLTVPVCGAVADLALLGLLWALCYLIYFLCTPAQCLPV